MKKNTAQMRHSCALSGRKQTRVLIRHHSPVTSVTSDTSDTTDTNVTTLPLRPGIAQHIHPSLAIFVLLLPYSLAFLAILRDHFL
jgi:hypothetical protein